MNSQQQKTLKAIFTRPVPKNVVFGQIESLMAALGCEIIERGGSCMAFKKGDMRLDMHRPHPAKEAKPYPSARREGVSGKLGRKTMKAMTYKGYAANIAYSDEDECFVGRVVGIKDIVVFHGESVQEIRAAFQESVDFYLTTCAERGEEPNKPYSGKILLRLDPATHAHIAMQAQAHGKSINQYAGEVLAQA